MRDMMPIGEEVDWAAIVARCRQSLNLQQKAMAHELRVTVGTISRWENGREVPGIDAQRRLKLMLQSLPDTGLLRRLLDTVDTADSLMTLLGPRMEVLSLSLKHQESSGHDLSEVRGKESERYWAPPFLQIMDVIGGRRGYRERGITRMDLKVEMIRHPGEPGYKPNTRLYTVGSTITYGPPEAPIAYLTQMRIVEGGEPQPPMVRYYDGELVPLA